MLFAFVQIKHSTALQMPTQRTPLPIDINHHTASLYPTKELFHILSTRRGMGRIDGRSMTKPVTLERLDNALYKLAAIIESTGDDTYWLLFDHLEHERDLLAARDKRIKRVKQRRQKPPHQMEAQSY